MGIDLRAKIGLKKKGPVVLVTVARRGLGVQVIAMVGNLANAITALMKSHAGRTIAKTVSTRTHMTMTKSTCPATKMSMKERFLSVVEDH